MLNRPIALWLALVAGPLSSPALAQGTQGHIPRAQIDVMFNQLKSKTGWDVSGPLLWSFYFTSPRKAALDAAGAALVAKGYALGEMLPPPPIASGGMGIWQLRVERVEHHTPDSLAQRNEDLSAFAATQKEVAYDGMDVGKVQ